MKLKLDEIKKKLEDNVAFLNDATPPTDWYYPNHSKNIAVHIKRNWFKNREQIAKTFEALANEMVKKFPKGHDMHLTAMSNSNSLRRLARILRSFADNQKEVEVSPLDAAYWQDASLPTDVLEMDFVQISKGNFVATDGDLYRLVQAEKKAKDDEDKRKKEEKMEKRRSGRRRGRKEEQEPSPEAPAEGTPEAAPTEQAASPAPASAKLGLRDYARYVLIVVLLAAALVFIFNMLSGNPIGDIIGTDQPTGTTSAPLLNPDGTPVDPAAQTGIGATQSISGTDTISRTTQTNQPLTAPLSSELQGLKSGIWKIIEMMMEQVFLAVIFLMVFTSYKVFLDRQAGGNPADFQLFLYGMIGFAIWVWLPIAEMAFPGQTIAALGKYEITIRALQNGIGLVGLAIYLVAVSADGIADFTPLSAGLYVAGWVFYLGRPSDFMAWTPPTSMWVAWALAIAIHFLELLRQQSTIVVCKFVSVGVATLFALFFVIVEGLETTSSPWILEYTQLIAFLVSMGAILGLMGFGLTRLSKSKVLPKNGAMTGAFVGAVETAAHDATILMAVAGGLFLVFFWS